MTTVYKRGILIAGGGENASVSARQADWDAVMTETPVNRKVGYRPGDLVVGLLARFDWWRFYKTSTGGTPTSQSQTTVRPSDPSDYTDSQYNFAAVLSNYFAMSAVQDDDALLFLEIRDIGPSPRYPAWLNNATYNGAFLSSGGTSRYMPRYDRYSGPDIDGNSDVGASPPIADEFIMFHQALFDYIDSLGYTDRIMGLAFYELYGNGGGSSPPSGYSPNNFNHGAMQRVKSTAQLWGAEGVPCYQSSMTGFGNPSLQVFFRYARDITELGEYTFGAIHPDLKFQSTTDNLKSRFTDPNVGDYLFGIIPLAQATEQNGERATLYFDPGVLTPWSYSNQTVAKTSLMDLWAMCGGPQADPPDDDSGLGQVGTDPSGIMPVDVVHINLSGMFGTQGWLDAFDTFGPLGTFAIPPGSGVGGGGGTGGGGSTTPAAFDASPIVTATLVAGATGATTTGVNTTGANFLVVTVQGITGDTFNVTDSKSNTYIPLTPSDDGLYVKTQIFYCEDTPTVGASHTFTVSSASGSRISAQAWAHDGTAVSVDAENQNDNNGSTTSTLASGAITPSVDGTLMISSLVQDVNFGGSCIINTGTVVQYADDTAVPGGAHSWYVQSTAATINQTWTWGINRYAAAAVVAFKATDSGVAPVITSDGGGSTAAVSINENTTYTTVVQATGDSPMVYSVTGGADAAAFSIGASSGVIDFLSAPDYEDPQDSNTDNDYVVEVTATNGSGTDVQTITVTILDVDEGSPPEPAGDYEATIGPFGNNTGAGKLVSQTVYVVYGLVDDEGVYAIPTHIPTDMAASVAIGNAQSVDLDSDGYGTLTLPFAGLYHGYVYRPDNTYVGALGNDGVIGVTAEDA